MAMNWSDTPYEDAARAEHQRRHPTVTPLTPAQREQLRTDAWDEERGWPPNDEDLVEYWFDSTQFEWVRL